jgi:GGDEF domain-containing protein
VRFQTSIIQFNEAQTANFELYIAHGFALYDEDNADVALDEVYQIADHRMYENKKFLKANQKSKMQSR